MNHFVLVKQPGFSRAGKQVPARDAAESILKAGFWPLWRNSRNRRAIKKGDQVAVYLGGDSEVIARATVADVEPWTRHHDTNYPLQLDGAPFGVLTLQDVHILATPVRVKLIKDGLSFIKPGSRKWGAGFMGGSRAITAGDFELLTGQVMLEAL
jgi:hypothetical protein